VPTEVVPRSNNERVNISIGDLGEFFQITIGKVLTIIDATTPDLEQRKAIKDLVKQSIWDIEARAFALDSENNILAGK